MVESEYQKALKKKIETIFPDCIILKNDPSWLQGFPDLTVLRGGKWAALEVKRSESAPHRPNQDYYVAKANGMSYSAFVYPENEEEVLNDLQSALGD